MEKAQPSNWIEGDCIKWVGREDLSVETGVKWAWSFKVKDMCYCSELNAEVHMKIQLSSIKPKINEISKKVNQCHSFQ